jgi:hypothetical protein
MQRAEIPFIGVRISWLTFANDAVVNAPKDDQQRRKAEEAGESDAGKDAHPVYLDRAAHAEGRGPGARS